MRAACKQGFLNATDFADYLVNKGMAFRQAHSVAGRAVALAIAENRELDDLSLAQLKALSDLVAEDVYEFIRLDQVVARRISAGGTGFDNVRAAVKKAAKELAPVMRFQAVLAISGDQLLRSVPAWKMSGIHPTGNLNELLRSVRSSGVIVFLGLMSDFVPGFRMRQKNTAPGPWKNPARPWHPRKM
jgi:hypothetical protein